MAKKILVVDDSALVRKELGKLFDRAGYDVGLAKNGKDALEFLEEVDFDLITLDINMPVMDGFTTLKEIMKIKPTPVLMISSLTTEDAEITFKCLEEGAIDFIPKPGTFSIDLKTQKELILSKVKDLLKIPKNKLIIKRKAHNTLKSLEKKKQTLSTSFDKIILIGSSTGGPGKIEEIVKSLPSDTPPVCIVQHMPEFFTAKFAERLDKISECVVVEAKNNDKVQRGKVIIAKGGKHLHFAKKASGQLRIKLIDNYSNRFFIPSIDEMFFSAAKVITDKKILAIELTGIGDDGADGMVELRKKGALTIAESEKTATVYGMPKEAYERGGAIKKLDFPDIIKEINSFIRK